MGTNRIPGGDIFRFKGLELHGFLTSTSDNCKPRLAVHEFLKRDGGRVEYMGRGVDRHRFQIVFVGQDARTRYQAFYQSVSADPRGDLVHPLLGQRRVVCEGWEGAALDISTATNSITVPVSFVEDNLDASTESAAVFGVPYFLDRTSANLTSMLAFLEIVRGTLETEVTKVVGVVNALTSSVSAWALPGMVVNSTTPDEASAGMSDATYLGPSDAVAGYKQAGSATGVQSVAADDWTIQPTLPNVKGLLDQVAVAVDDLLAGLRGLDDAEHNGDIFRSIEAAESLYSSAVELCDAVERQGGTVEDYTAPDLMHVLVLSAERYGAEALLHVDEILTNNQIENPAGILPGTSLRLVRATAGG